MKMLCDNTAAIQIAKDLKFHLQSKHIKRHFYYMWDTIKTKEIVIKYIASKKMLIAPLNKPIPRDAFNAYMLSLKLHKV